MLFLILTSRHVYNEWCIDNGLEFVEVIDSEPANAPVAPTEATRRNPGDDDEEEEDRFGTLFTTQSLQFCFLLLFFKWALKVGRE
jgi:hypothetical protein